MNSNKFLPYKTTENKFFSMDPNSNNYTKKNFFPNVRSENQIKFMTNNNLNNELTNINDKQESNQQLLNINYDNKKKGFHLNSFNQKKLNPFFETSKNKDFKNTNNNINTNGLGSFKDATNKRTSSFIRNNSNGINSNKNKLSELKLPNIK